MRRFEGAHKLMAAASLSAALALFAAPATALAAPNEKPKYEVAGYDYVYAGQTKEDGSVDVLTVTGDASGETIYLDVKQGDTTIASHLRFMLTEENSKLDANGELVGVVSIKPSPSVSLEGAKISVYSDRAETKRIYDGTISTVYARVNTPSGKIDVPLATRTLESDEKRAFEAPDTFEYEGVVYVRSSVDPITESGTTYYAYEVSGDVAPSIDGHVNYYTAADTDTPFYTETVEGIALGESRTVEVPSIVSSNGGLYRTLQLSGSLTLSYPGVSEYSVMCMPLSKEWGKVGSFYNASINYVDEAGKSLGISDSVIVNKSYLYTPPSRLHVMSEDGTYVTYALSDKNNELNESGALVFEPGAAEGSATYNVVYEKLADDAERTWTVILVNGDKSIKNPKDPAREIQRITYKGKPGEKVTHETLPSIDVDGVTYVPAAAAQDSYEHTFGIAESEIEQTIYYVPGNYVAPEAYEVTVNYVEFTTQQVISSETYTAAPTMRSDLKIETPETFTANGVDYIRLNGQEQPIGHSFFAGPKTYTVYYRDVNDTLSANVVITGVRTEYIDVEGNTIRRPVTVIDEGVTDEGTTTTDAGIDSSSADAGVNATTTDGIAAAIQTGLTTEDTIRTIVDDETPLGLVTSDGTDLATVRIEDDETPLASGTEGAQAAAAAVQPGVIVATVAGIAALVALIVFFFTKRRKSADEETSSNDNANA